MDNAVFCDKCAPAVNVWITKPHVVNSSIFAAKVTACDEFSLTRIVYLKSQLPISKFVETIEISADEYHFESDYTSYFLTLIGQTFQADVKRCAPDSPISATWIRDVLLKKLNQWTLQNINQTPPSLNLVDPGIYQDDYLRMKATYGREIIELWCEKTDPQKFVFEDIAIAAYLISLWKNQSAVHFVDLGCGNGLLTHILISEGFRGIGVDVRRRRIWDSYPSSTQDCLLEMTLNPEASTVFPEANWLIGNHSDELTPWIPVLASRSNESCKIFVLPCCPFGLFGKYNGFMHSCENATDINKLESSTNKLPESRYRVYLSYLRSLFTVCGFVPEMDVLRIPSTKRTCIIGRTIMKSITFPDRLVCVSKAVEMERHAVISSTCYDKFVPRDYSEPVLNCTRIPTTIKMDVGHLLFELLLKAPKTNSDQLKASGVISSECGHLKTVDGRWWNPGGVIELGDFAKLLSADQLNAMKDQHGGLRTLIRNHHQAFLTIRSQIQIRWTASKMASCEDSNTISMKNTTSKTKPYKSILKRKTKRCWLFDNHPDKCPYPDELCDFIHEPDDQPNPSRNEVPYNSNDKRHHKL